MQRGFYSLEMRRQVLVRSLTAMSMARAYAVEEHLSHRDEHAAQMGVMLEVLRGGLVDPAIETNEALIEFAGRYPKTAWRAFCAIRDMTTYD